MGRLDNICGRRRRLRHRRRLHLHFLNFNDAVLTRRRDVSTLFVVVVVVAQRLSLPPPRRRRRRRLAPSDRPRRRQRLPQPAVAVSGDGVVFEVARVEVDALVEVPVVEGARTD